MALTRITSGGIAPGIVIKFDSNNTPTLPAISFDNGSDTGTGIYQPADNEIAIATAGIERFRVKSDGKIVTGDGTILGGTNPDFANAENIMLYVNQSDKNATDSVDNDGGNVNQPFKTIERALLEAAKRSHKVGPANDKFEAFTIMVMPGQYEIDNRPGVEGTSNLTFGTFANELYKFNPKTGGVIVPRGTSIVGYDLRKTVIRPKFVPDPASALGFNTNDALSISHLNYDGANMIERNRGYIQEQTKLYLAATQSGYQNLTQAEKDLCVRDIGYFIDGIVADLRGGGNENSFIVGEFYTNGTTNEFLNSTSEITATVNGFNRARDLMIRTVEDNWVGYSAYSGEVARTIYSAGNGYLANGDCSTVSSAITALSAIVTGIINNPDTYTTLFTKTPGVLEQTAIFKVTGGCYFWQMTFKDARTAPFNGVSYSGGVPSFTTAANASYSHHRVVAFTYADQRTTDGELDQYYTKIDHWAGDDREVRTEEYEIVGDRSLVTTIDTVNSCSPYIFNCSLRSTFGMCGMHTDGSKVAENSFKSMVVAQFTGISLQKDENAFYQPIDPEGDIIDPPAYADPNSNYKPEWRHFHIKASNGGFIQVVSVFAVGYADQFLAESGGDMSITNSNSNFGQLSLRAKGSQFKSFAPANQGKITALIPPRGISSVITNIEFYGIDYRTTWNENEITSKEYSKNVRDRFVANTAKFKLYLDIPGVNAEEDIPELVAESTDYSTSTTVRKRFLSYGSNLNYNLFRDYYGPSGVVAADQAKIAVLVEREGGESIPYSARIALGTEAGNVTENNGNNAERQGYFWDAKVNKVYIKVDAVDSATDKFLTDFVFSTVTESVFTTRVKTVDGIVTTETVTEDIAVLEYYDGFPTVLTTEKFVDARSSAPAELLWRLEYTIPKTLSGNVKPKPPEKRFIIKGTRAGNGIDGVPYTDYRFMIWDVEEVTSWEAGVTDGKYYLTVVRADINKFNDTTANVPDTIRRRPLGITAGEYFETSFIEEINNYDKDTKLIANINYLYPSINEEGPIFDVRKIWNPPQSDSRVLIEDIGSGNRIKDIAVPNVTFYRGSSTPFKEVPALTSITAESVHRLVQALDLRYAQSTSAASTRVKVSPAPVWDARVGLNEIVSSSIDIYGTGSFRFGTAGSQTTISTGKENQNEYGIDAEAEDRRIPVVSAGTTFTSTTLNEHTPCPSLPLYRPSILRASSHTWEYVGLGSGNYSTGFPNLQTRVLKPYEQFIAQGYENSGGFVASSGTNSNGDFYIGNQVIQAGGTSSVTLNVPKVRKSSESNYVNIENLENRIANAVVNITAASNANANSQAALKALSNFFTTAKLSVTDRATIQTAIINDRLFISNTRIANGEKFPEGNTQGFGFVKAARPEKTGFISTDTNDRLYVSPKYLDAWRIKRQLISASNVTLDNNRIYIQPLNSTLLDSANGTSIALSATSTEIKLLESAGIPSSGTIDIQMDLRYVDVTDYRLVSGEKVYLNDNINVALDYDTIDYTTNIATISAKQNNIAKQTYLENLLTTGTYNTVIKHWSDPVSDINNISEKDLKYLRSLVQANVVVVNIDNPSGNPLSPSNTTTITIDSTDWAVWPDRGAITFREKPSGGTLRYSTYVFHKGGIAGQLVLLRKVINASSNDTGHTYTTTYDNGISVIPNKNVFFSGCTSTVVFADRWAKEEPFIPSVEVISEDVDLESATLYSPPERLIAYTGVIDDTFVDTRLPNPYSSKALGVNLQNKQAVKKFSPLSNFKQVQQWCDKIGFNVNDKVELLLKPGYYKLDDSTFPCQIVVKGSGIKEDTGNFAGKELTRTGNNEIGGYTETSVRRGSSVFLYRTPRFFYRTGSVFGASVGGGLTSKGGFKFSNVHFLSLNEAVIKNEILDDVYADGDSGLASARRVVRLAYYVKNTPSFPASSNGVVSGLTFNAHDTNVINNSLVKIDYYLNSDDVLKSNYQQSDDGDLNPADKTNCRYIKFTLEAKRFASSPADFQNFIWARNYIIPGSALYWLPSGGNVNSNTQKTKIIDVRYTDKSNASTWSASSTEKIEFLVSIYQDGSSDVNNGNNSDYTNIIEDLDISGFAGGSATFVIANEIGSEFTTLAYNYVLNRRRSQTPRDFSFSGNYSAVIVRTVTSTASSGATQLTLNSLEGLNTGDIIHGIGIPSNTTITLPGSGTTVTLSAATTAEITQNQKVTFTQYDQFGELIPKYDRPKVYGVINSFEAGEIGLVIDTNPNKEIDSTIQKYPYGFSEGTLIQFKQSTGEDGAITLPRVAFGTPYNEYYGRTLYGQSGRYVVYSFYPSIIAATGSANDPSATYVPYIDNAGISASILSRFTTFGSFASFDQGGGHGTGASLGTVTVTGGAITGIQILNGGSGYNTAAIVTLSGGATPTTPTRVNVQVNSNGTITGFTFTNSGGAGYSGTYTATVIDRKGYIMVNNNLVSLSTTRFRSDDEFRAVAKENILNELCPFLESGTRYTGPVSGETYLTTINRLYNTAIGKTTYSNWSQSYRGLRRRTPIGDVPVTGNYCSPILNVDAIPGTNAPLYLEGCTIGAQSPSDTAANRYDGSYSGGLFKARGGDINLAGVRFRGNISLDWTGLFSVGGNRSGSQFAYGHSVEMFQLEDQNKIASIGGKTGVGNATEKNCFLESVVDPDGNVIDYDSRIFGFTTVQAVRKYYYGDTNITVDGTTIQPGYLLEKIVLTEKYYTPNPINYNEYTGSESGFRLRWNNTTRVLTFFYEEADSEFIRNIFATGSRTSIVNNANINRSYAIVTGVTISQVNYNTDGSVNNNGGLYKQATINYSGSIPLTEADGSAIKFFTNYSNTDKLKYITTVTSRYAKLNSGQISVLNLADSGEQIIAINSDIRVVQNATVQANLTRTTPVYLINRSRTGTTPARAYISTNASGSITSFDVFDYGSGHRERDEFNINTNSNGTGTDISQTTKIVVSAVRNLVDDVTILEPGELMTVLPRNCYVINSINNATSIVTLKTELQKLKTILRPGSRIGSYNIALDNQSMDNKPYIGVYRYVNPLNTEDIRASIVVMLEDINYAPTMTSNQRIDVYEYDNILKYWPTSGKLTIANSDTRRANSYEICKFVKSFSDSTGYALTLTRSMTDYFPTTMLDWVGIDPYDTSNDTTASSVTYIDLADPIDVTCYGFKRIKPENSTLQNATVTSYINPSGKYTDKIAKITIPSSTNTINSDFEKLSIGQVVTVPYRDTSVAVSGAVWGNITFTVGSALSTRSSSDSTNREGDTKISGTLSVSSGTFSVNPTASRFQVTGSSVTNNVIYQSVNPNTVGYLYVYNKGNPDPVSSGYQISTAGYRYWNYRWLDILGAYEGTYNEDGTLNPDPATNQITVTGNTFEIASSGTYTASLTNGSNIINVTGVTSGALYKGQSITGTGIPAGTVIVEGENINDPDNSLTGRGGTGTYRISNNATSTTSSTITGSIFSGATEYDYLTYYPGQNTNWSRRITLKSYNNSNGQTTFTLNANVFRSFSGGSMLVYSYSIYEEGFIMQLNSSLIQDIPAGTQFGIYVETSASSSHNYAFRSKIVDIEKDAVNNEIDVYLADELPSNWTNSGMRHYGYTFINDAGWTYPRVGGSSFRTNNVIPGTSSTTIYLPNRSGRVQPGDVITYEWEDSSSGSVTKHSSTITNVGTVDAVHSGMSLCTLSSSTGHILYNTYGTKVNWMSIDEVFVSHRQGNFSFDGPVCDKFFYSDTGIKLTFDDYSIWPSRYYPSGTSQNWDYTYPPGVGWVGNFSISKVNKSVDGLVLDGASDLNWGRQTNNSIWQSAAPYYPNFSGQSFPWEYFSTNIVSSASIISNYANNKLVNYDSAGNFYFNPINHSWIALSNVYANLDTSDNNGCGAYDVQRYKLTRTRTTLRYSLQDSSISTSNGSVSGGSNPRVTEQFVLNNAIHYKPCLDFESSNLLGSGSITTSTSSTTVTGSGATFTQYLLPGDNLYSTSTGTPTYIGTIQSVDNDNQLTLIANAGVTTTSDSDWSYISRYVKKGGENAISRDLILSGGGLSSGVTPLTYGTTGGFNVIAINRPAYDKFNFRFGVTKRNYNQTPLLNTYRDIVPIANVSDSNKVIRLQVGDLSVYRPVSINVNVTRFNPKTHVERSISVVGSQINI